jgi:Holliday junction resolvase
MFNISKIIGICGLQGTGKTMLMTKLGQIAHKKSGSKIYANYHISYDYTPIVSLNDIDRMRDGIFLADELWLWLFSRSSMTKLNQELSKLIMLNRKRRLTIIYTAQLYRTVDILLRRVTNFTITPNIVRIGEFENEYEYTIKFRICNEIGQFLKNGIIRSNLKEMGAQYNTLEEIKGLGEKTPLENGITLEKKFYQAISKLGFVRYVELLPYSGRTSTWNYDIVAYCPGKTLAIDVKGSGKERVCLNCFGKDLKKKIKNAYDHNAIPLIAFPNNTAKRLTDPKFWNIYKLDYYSYLLKLSRDPAYQKLAKNSINLKNMDNLDL